MNAAPSSGAASEQSLWQIHRHVVTVHGVSRMLRLSRFERGWLASVDTEMGPTVGTDHSPYLAAHRALEPLGVGLVEAMTLVGPIVEPSPTRAR